MIRIDLKEYECAVERRKAELGLPERGYVAPNSGVSRTPEKRALLRCLEENALKQGREPRFKANY